ncbi:protein FAM234B isoform 1-T1 [Synchiropus picturatus]
MAAALSRALKLPGKKGSELGEYDPLTQADSEDDSEDDDLVLNYPRNGLGRDLCHGSSKPRGGRSGRHITAGDDAPDEEDEWREQPPSKSGQDGDQAKPWGPAGDDGRGPPPSGGPGSCEAEEKRLRIKTAVRTLCFVVPLVCAGALVLLCAFLIPCRSGGLAKRSQWERALGEAGGVTPPALTLWDIDGDSVDDIILGVTDWTNGSHLLPANKIYSAVALSSARGHMLWRKTMKETVMYIQCGLQPPSSQLPACLLIGKSIIVAVNVTTGKTLWSNKALKNIESQAVLLPDLQGDLVPDLLLATLPEDETLDLSLTLISGLTGEKLGQSVPFNLTGQGKLIGPLIHETQQGSYYVLFGLGNVEAVSLRDVYARATGRPPVAPLLRRRDPVWEGLKKTNSSSFIHIYRGSERVDFLLPLVAGFGNNHNCLDQLSNRNSSRSDWVLVYGSSKLSLLRQRDVHKQWTFISPPLHSQPVPGHFNDDGVLDLFVQHSANGVMKALVIDGANSRVLWSEEFVCPRLVMEPSAVFTSGSQSAFLFWAGDPIRAQRNVSRPTVSPAGLLRWDLTDLRRLMLQVSPAAAPLIRKLFLLHPAFPTILLELNSTTDTSVTSAVSYQPSQSDATYISVSSRPTTDSESGTRVIRSIGLRAAISRAHLVRLGDQDKTGPDKAGTLEVTKFFRRLAFTHP